MSRDLVNLRPISHLDARWVLVGDIDRGGIYAQLAGTWALLPEDMRQRSLGCIINRFRGDLSLFPNPQEWLTPHAPGFRVLGTVPFAADLRPDEEDGIDPFDCDRGEGDELVWIRLPHTAILNDCQPWWDDSGVRVRWITKPSEIGNAKAIVIPGTKNTIADMRWLRASGMAEALLAAAARGVPIAGICGGYQILGQTMSDPRGVAGDAGDEPGLGLLPLHTEFLDPKIVTQQVSTFSGRQWATYEIHMGRSHATSSVEPLHFTSAGVGQTPEGMSCGKILGTYQHGWFDVPETRQAFAQLAGMTRHRAHPIAWAQRRREIYQGMADLLEAHVDLDSVRRHFGL